MVKTPLAVVGLSAAITDSGTSDRGAQNKFIVCTGLSKLISSGTAEAASLENVSIPVATCGPGSDPETGLQGQVSLADRKSGRSPRGYSSNLERIGQYRGEGASWVDLFYKLPLHADHFERAAEKSRLAAQFFSTNE